MIPYLLVEQAVRAGLLEDLGRAGDITTEAVVPSERRAVCTLVARDPGVVAGLDFARAAFAMVDPSVNFNVRLPDASRVAPGEVIAEISGSARGILTGERVALNFLGPLSGIATATRGIADAIKHTKARITCTRKTTPGLRFAQKYAVRCGGGANHRFGLDDAILIKDNHIALAGGIIPALRAAKRMAGHLVKIEIEVDTLEQLQEVLREGADAVLLDNMDTTQLRQAVAMIDGKAIAEASGRITPASAAGIAETGVDLISAGWLTHSAKVLDIGLDFVRVS
ncbi:nicotinate-nucleotide diphosphorylase (carboxylating) [Acidocella aquatica]|uniref:nicotinate-nucleotide diphosphorylase (carboxylating) n=1 Tax=Acidocella aquatica TaxID=1922313 RepID=A0ABQ6AF69_9PROT|nr:carboxylating nicotinate-nucleotide diphosphorylase [Acidocella aquatica]GLR68868.1 nicotinate-nucleotide diphosphorylase (carboxylating) [Acidocella aquatica]